MSTPPPERRHDLDWLRAFAILLVVVFHSAMPYVAEWGWHVKNAERSELLLEMNWFLSRWRMALLFLIAGAGTTWALGGRAVDAYLRERARRLLVPLVFGILVVVPPQIYMERIAAGVSYASYLDFWPSVLQGRAYPAGNTSWHHLWFIAYLFLYSLLALPLLAWLRGARRERLAAPLARAAAGPLLWAPGIGLGVVLALMLPRWPGPQDIVHDWAMFTYYLAYFVVGAVVADARGVWEAVERRRESALRVAVVSLLMCGWVRWNDHSPELGAGAAWVAYALLLATVGWSWVLTMLGYGRRYLSHTGPALDWAREASYPVYVLHQTVIVVVAAYVVRTPESILAKFAFTTVVSLALTVLLYQTLVRPYAPMRAAFGLKQRAAARTSAAVRHGSVAPGVNAA